MKFFNGDCLEEMKGIESGVVDFILTDPPYGTISCKWDSVIPIEPMWKELKRIIKPNGAVCLFGTEPFSSLLRLSNIKEYKYDWIWQKHISTNHLNVRRQPMRKTELISTFYKEQCTYIPQLENLVKTSVRKTPATHRPNIEQYGKMDKVSDRTIPSDLMYPNENLFFNNRIAKSNKKHPSQKPVDLIEHLIKTYTNENEIVLDFAMGSGTTGVACRNLNRDFIGIELDEKYFQIAQERIGQV